MADRIGTISYEILPHRARLPRRHVRGAAGPL